MLDVNDPWTCVVSAQGVGHFLAGWNLLMPSSFTMVPRAVSAHRNLRRRSRRCFLLVAHQPRHLTRDHPRVVLLQVLTVARIEWIVFGPTIWIAAHTMKRQGRELVGTGRVDIHLFTEAVGIKQKCAGPSRR